MREVNQGVLVSVQISGLRLACTCEFMGTGKRKRRPSSVVDADASAIVAHALPDDNTTNPTGNSVNRIAFSAIEKGSAK